MKLNIENCANNGDEGGKAWTLDELVRNLKEMRNRSNAGDMHAAVTEFFEVFRFNDGVGVAALAAPPGAVGEPTDADWADFGAWAERDKGAMDMLGKLIDVWDDGQLPHEHRCYVDGAWSELIAEARALIAAAPTEAKPEATQQASGERKPYAYAVYFPDQPTEELVHDLDELCEDMTNREHTITELFAALSTPAQQDAVDADDPLQGAVDWLLQADGEFFCVATVQRTLRIGYNRANRLSEVAKERAAISAKKGGA